MTEQERFNENVVRRLDVQDERFTSVTNNINSLTNELREFKQEMRQQNEMRAADIAALREKDDKLAEEMRSMGKHFQNVTWAMLAAVAAMVVSVWKR